MVLFILKGLKISISILLVKFVRLFCNVRLIVKFVVFMMVINEVVLIFIIEVIEINSIIFSIVLISLYRNLFNVGFFLFS